MPLKGCKLHVLHHGMWVLGAECDESTNFNMEQEGKDSGSW